MEKVIYTKYAGRGERFFKGEFVFISDGIYQMRISEQKITKAETTETKRQKVTVETPVILPGEEFKSVTAKSKAQKQIDEYLQENNLTIEEALTVVKKGKKEGRKIELDLDITVQYALKQDQKIEEVPLIKTTNVQTFEGCATVPVYVRLLPHLFRKSFINFINTL